MEIHWPELRALFWGEKIPTDPKLQSFALKASFLSTFWELICVIKSNVFFGGEGLKKNIAFTCSWFLKEDLSLNHRDVSEIEGRHSTRKAKA